jgi:hypothetical protein
VYFFTPERVNILLRDAWLHLQNQGFYLDPIVPKDLFRSFWAMPGWAIFYLHPFWYWLLGAGCVLAIIGLGLGIMAHRSDLLTKKRAQFQALVVLAVAIIAAIGVLLIWNGLSHSIIYRQGRSIYPVIIPISLFLMLGWRQLIPQGWRKIGLLAITLASFLFDSMMLFSYIIPFFYSRY